MPVVNIGHIVWYNWATDYDTVCYNQLAGLALTSELSTYSYLEPSRRLPTGLKIKLPSYLVNSIQSIFNFNGNVWKLLTKYHQVKDNIEFSSKPTGILLGFSRDSFSEVYYDNGEYIHEFYLSRRDTRVYKDIKLSLASHLIQDNITLYISESKQGPWKKELNLPRIVPKFYLKVIVNGFEHIENELIIPTEIISISCLVCE